MNDCSDKVKESVPFKVKTSTDMRITNQKFHKRPDISKSANKDYLINGAKVNKTTCVLKKAAQRAPELHQGKKEFSDLMKSERCESQKNIYSEVVKSEKPSEVSLEDINEKLSYISREMVGISEKIHEQCSSLLEIFHNRQSTNKEPTGDDEMARKLERTHATPTIDKNNHLQKAESKLSTLSERIRNLMGRNRRVFIFLIISTTAILVVCGFVGTDHPILENLVSSVIGFIKKTINSESTDVALADDTFSRCHQILLHLYNFWKESQMRSALKMLHGMYCMR